MPSTCTSALRTFDAAGFRSLLHRDSTTGTKPTAPMRGGFSGGCFPERRVAFPKGMARVGSLDGWTKSADTISATSDVTRSGKFKRHFDSDAASCFLNL